MENIFYAQHELLQRDVASLAPQRAGTPDVYFVGFGSYAREDVFMKEIEYAAGALDARFGSGERTIKLINNPKTVEEGPLATSHNLRAALAGVAEQMDTEEDVLFLYMTSHGSKKDGMSVDFWPMELNDIDTATLREALDDSGIKWRILLVSACYSGQFLEPLQDEHTLVMTASAADRQSFGCGAASEFTYFGEAIFKHELAKEQPLRQALYRAIDGIEAREVSEKRTPSKPQIFIGDAMRAKLIELEKHYPYETENIGSQTASSAGP